MDVINLITRLLRGLLNAIKRKEKKDAVNDPAGTIANGGRVHKSDKSFSELSEQSKRDKAK